MSRNHISTMTSHISCGVLEVGSLLNEVDANIYEIGNSLYHPSRGAPQAFLMLSDRPLVNENPVPSVATLLVGRLQELGLADFVVSKDAINPRSGSLICVWVGTIQHEEYRRWYNNIVAERLARRC